MPDFSVPSWLVPPSQLQERELALRRDALKTQQYLNLQHEARTREAAALKAQQLLQQQLGMKAALEGAQEDLKAGKYTDIQEALRANLFLQAPKIFGSNPAELSQALGREETLEVRERLGQERSAIDRERIEMQRQNAALKAEVEAMKEAERGKRLETTEEGKDRRLGVVEEGKDRRFQERMADTDGGFEVFPLNDQESAVRVSGSKSFRIFSTSKLSDTDRIAYSEAVKSLRDIDRELAKEPYRPTLKDEKGEKVPAAVSDKRIELLKQRRVVEERIQSLLGKVDEGAAPAASTNRVTVRKDGKTFTLPRTQLDQALKQGYQLVE